MERAKVDENLSVIQNIELNDIEPISHAGIYSTVWRAKAHENRDHLPIDVVIKKHTIDTNALDVLLGDWQDYRDTLTFYEPTTGISVPKTLGHEVRDDAIYFVDESSGQADMARILNDETISFDRRQYLMAMLFRAIAKIPRDDHHQTSFMIDGKLSNFCPKEDGTFTYVDVFPAHMRDGQSHLLKPSADHISKKRSIYTDSFITGDMYGILGRFLETLYRDYPDLWDSMQENSYIQAVFGNLPQDLLAYCSFLLEDDSRFIQTLYQFGIEYSDSPQLDTILNPIRYGINS